MYNNPYFIPGFYKPPVFGMMRGITPSMGYARGLGLMNRIGGGFNWFKNINWSNLINGASKTLGVVNQTIPLVKQVGPMFNNMRSIFRVVSAFRDVTDNSNQKITNNNNNVNSNSTKISDNYVNGPTFFTP